MTPVALMALAALAQPASPAGARLATPGGSLLVIEALDVQWVFKKREVTFTSRGAPVTLTRDDARLSCKELVARTDAASRIESATCRGDVTFVRGERTLACERATFDGTTDKVTCEGDAVLREAGSEARGTRVVYDLRADEVRLEGAPGKPVRILVPGEEIDRRQEELEKRRKEARR